MDKEFLKIKDKPYFSQELSEFISKLQLMGISAKKRKKLEKEIMGFLLKVKENIYREVERKYFKEDVMTKIKEYYGLKGLKLAKLFERFTSILSDEKVRQKSMLKRIILQAVASH